ncbi:hypothetical protein [Anaerococcus vaginalis]|uniref:hypothetical protein n=1 Tax=Anaerococcus vaginalis TaxID=33037 RepID=UPI00290EBA46|nr:hypothetical protein [Anaerococcus vaginalis]MDU6546455.1 hypothetical protein [Anaerococcus vaginalis]
MVKVVVLLMLIVPSFYNFIDQRNNKIRVKKNSNLGFILAIFASITSIFWYRLDRSLLGFLILLSAILLVYTIGFLPGIGKDGISVFMGSTPILKFISFDQIKDVSLKENYNDIKLSINAFGEIYISKFMK